MKLEATLLLVVLALTSTFRAQAQTKGNVVPVTVDNFIRAESDRYFGGLLKDSGMQFA